MRIFDFNSVRAYLKSHFKSLPKRGRGEVTRIASSLDVSTTLVSQVISGNKFFTLEQGLKLGRYLGFLELEFDFLICLIEFERSGSKNLSEYWKSKMSDLRRQSLDLASRVGVDGVLKEEDKAVFYSSTLYSAVRLFTSLENRDIRVESVCERFNLTRVRAFEILNFLTRKGLCVEDDGIYKLGVQKTHLERGSPFLTKHYSNWRLKAIQECENLESEELMYSAPVSLSRKDFVILREEMAEFLTSFLERVHDSPAEEIACFNMDFFWIGK